MYCPKCGKELENGASFCGYCGASINPQPEYGSNNQQQAAPINNQTQPNYNQAQQTGAPSQPAYNQAQQTGAQTQPNYNQAQPTYAQSAPVYTNSAPVFDRRAVSKKEFIEKYASPKLRKNINSMAIVCYVLAAISVVSSVALTGSFWALIDVVILLGLTLGMHLGKSKACAIILLIISIIECVLTSIMLGTLSGWWWIIAAASAVSSFAKIDKEYNIFLMEASLNSPYAPASPFAQTAPAQPSAQPFVPTAPAQAPAQPFAPDAPAQPSAQTEVYYTPPQPAEPEATPEQPSAPLEEAPVEAPESLD